MTTAEATVTMIRQLSEPELLDVQNYIKFMFPKKRKVGLKKYSAKEICAMLDESLEQAKQGKIIPYSRVRKELSRKYAF